VDIDKKLEDARNSRDNYGNKRGLKDTADDYLKGEYALLYLKVPDDYKTVPERDAWIRRQPEYKRAIEAKKMRYADWTAAELYMKILFAEVEKYRTDAATDRTMDRAHR